MGVDFKRPFMHKIIITLMMSLFVIACQAQRFKHSVGGGFSIADFKTINNNGADVLSRSILQLNATYYPHFEIIRLKTSSLYIGSPISLSYAITTGEGTSVGFGYDLPLILEHKLKFSKKKSLEGYYGAGLGYIYYGKLSTNLKFKRTNTQLYTHAGVRFPMSKGTWTIEGIRLGVFYEKGFGTANYPRTGLSLLADL